MQKNKNDTGLSTVLPFANAGAGQLPAPSYTALLKNVVDDARRRNFAVWSAPRDKCFAVMADEMSRLRDEHPTFFALRQSMHEAADVALEAKGLMRLGKFWDDRLASALFPYPQKLKSRVVAVPDPQNPEIVDMYFHQFMANVSQSLHSQPAFLYNFLEESGYVLMVAERLGHISLAYEIDGDMRGNSEATAKAVHLDKVRQIDIPMLSRREGKDGWEYEDTHTNDDDIDMTLAHEIFHGLDEFLGDFSKHDKALRSAYDEDIKNFSRRMLARGDQHTLKGYLPKSKGGNWPSKEDALIEAFAETGAESAIASSSGMLTSYLPKTAAVVTRLMDTLKYVYAAHPSALLAPSLNKATCAKPSLAVLNF